MLGVVAQRRPQMKRVVYTQGVPLYTKQEALCRESQRQMARQKTPIGRSARNQMRRARAARLADSYLRKLLSANTALTPRDIPIPLIEAERERLHIVRALKDNP